jgi:hypothetical protein
MARNVNFWLASMPLLICMILQLFPEKRLNLFLFNTMPNATATLRKEEK